MEGNKYVYLFEEGSADLKNLLGGKGANLAEMTNIGLTVPPGMIITTEACNAFYEKNLQFPPGMEEQVQDKLKVLENETGKKFGDPKAPLLVSVRSGAPISMPGMMDTVLNLGLNDETVQGLAAQSNDERFAMDCYRRFLNMFGDVVLGIEHQKFEDYLQRKKNQKNYQFDYELSASDWKEVIENYKQLIEKETGKPFPQDPEEQLFKAIYAVFNSWNIDRAIVYRRVNKIPDDLGTAVNIVAMVYGNLGDDCGTGVAFTRDPSTGEKNLYGEYLTNAQGEDVVAGIRTPRHISSLKDEMPDVYEQFVNTCHLLEEHYRDVQDIEFTIERGKLYLLQTRKGKRTAQAALKIAVDMVKEGLISKEKALNMVEPSHLDNLLHRRIDPNAELDIAAKGLPASPGAASGQIIFNADEAEKKAQEGQKVILVRTETTPDDIHGIVASQGVLTSRGGMTSHAAVVARGMGKPCVCGCEALQINYEKETFLVEDRQFNKGDILSVDGGTGHVIVGEVPMLEPELSDEFQQLLEWADATRKLGIRANADTPQDAAKSRELGAEGIGLCRTEHMFMGNDRLPIVQEMILARSEEKRKEALDKLLPMQEEDFYGILKAMSGFPVTIRFLDPPLHEFLPDKEELLVEITELRITNGDKDKLAEKEDLLKQVRQLTEFNPMLGHRGCRLGITYPEICNMQARAIFQATARLVKEGYDVLPEVEIPLIGDINELSFVRKDVIEIADKVIEESGVKFNYMIGTMIEVPRATLLSGEIAKEAEFFSFGTNDLTQTTFGFSRDDAEAKFLHEYIDKKILAENPFIVLDRDGVGRLMEVSVQESRKTNPDLLIGICGEHGGEPNSIEFCHLVGLNYVSCSPFRVPIARLSAAQAKINN
ncbi:MAG: pyruvate, phosphate dikinase [Clostridiales bacterium]|nr:pyruvate, phosphate dikinase [Clostridiales bacterium]MCF8021431.1 pyruvate, phosphate dikinase [Clostridiales bacterium]